MRHTVYAPHCMCSTLFHHVYISPCVCSTLCMIHTVHALHNVLQAHAILKDLDLDMTSRLKDGWVSRLAYQLRADCGLLEQCKIMVSALIQPPG